MTAAGALLFGRYAFPPNQLGYCGPDDHQALLEYVATRTVDQGLVELERRFSGAYPYLCLIAAANRIQDPFDERVVEAYWVGSPLLARVDANRFRDSLHERFAARMKTPEFGWLASKLEHGAHPHHNFHVFDVYMRAGMMNDARASIALSTMDSCRISWGQVQELAGAELVVVRQPLVFDRGKLALGAPESRRVQRQFGGHGLVDEVAVGQTVSVHWDWACDVLSSGQLRRLRAATEKYLGLANQTI